MQPLDSSTIFSTADSPVTTVPSMPISPISFITTATRLPLSPWSSAWRSSVVLPLPRKPVRMSTATVRTTASGTPTNGQYRQCHLVGVQRANPLVTGVRRGWQTKKAGSALRSHTLPQLPQQAHDFRGTEPHNGGQCDAGLAQERHQEHQRGHTVGEAAGGGRPDDPAVRHEPEVAAGGDTERQPG